MAEIDVRHIHVLEFPKQMLWTDRDLEYFLEEMPGDAHKMNNDIYDVFLKEVKSGQGHSPEEAFNLAYYECVRISLAKYPESKDLFDVLEMDIQHNQSQVDYGFTDLIMNMVWAMLHSTGTARRFSDKLHSYLVNSKKLKFWFRDFFTPNDKVHIIYPYKKEEEPKYKWKFTPCPDDMKIKPADGDWCKLTIGYKEHLIEELLLLWPADKRETIRKRIMDEKTRQTKHFEDFANSYYYLDFSFNDTEGEKPRERRKSQFRLDTEKQLQCQSDIEQIRKESVEWKRKHDELEKELSMWKKKYLDLESEQVPEKAFNTQTGKPCLTSTQMGIFLQAVSELTENPPPGKTTLGDVVENIAGYSATTVNQNMKGAHRPKDISAIVKALGVCLPNLTEKVKKL